MKGISNVVGALATVDLKNKQTEPGIRERIAQLKSTTKKSSGDLKRLTVTKFSVIIFTNPGYDTWSIFKRSLTGLISEFSFS